MSDLSLHRSGYATNRHRSPGALAAAIAINGGAFALILALPATQYVVDHGPDLVTHWIDIEPVPPETMPEPVSHETPRPMQKSNPVPDDVRPYVPPQVVPLGGTGAVGGGTLPAIGDLGGLTDLRPLPPPRDPLFVRATQDPRFANAFHPPYPPSLVRQGLEGSVTVRVTIDETGRVTACDLVKATNRAFYDETRDQALRYWRFRPATSDGAPVRSEQTLTVTFRLEDI